MSVTILASGITTCLRTGIDSVICLLPNDDMPIKHAGYGGITWAFVSTGVVAFRVRFYCDGEPFVAEFPVESVILEKAADQWGMLVATERLSTAILEDLFMEMSGLVNPGREGDLHYTKKL